MRLLPVLLFLIASVAECLMLNRVLVPQYKLFGEDALLRCDYNMGRDRLYAVKWYKDNEEFFRYVPRFKPLIRTHPVEGVHVDDARSSENKVMLRSLTVRSSGGYRCEVSAEAPSFSSIQGEGRMTVVYLPKEPPQITGHVRDEYEVGNVLDLNCTSAKSFPPAKLSWYINDSPVHVPPGSISIYPASSAEHSTPQQQHEQQQQHQHQQRHHYSFGTATTSATNVAAAATTSASSSLASSLMISSLGLQLQLESHHFGPKGTAKVRCVARISPLFWQDGDEKILSGNHGNHGRNGGLHHRHGRKKPLGGGEKYGGDELVSSGEEVDENGEEMEGKEERTHAHHNSNTNNNRGGYHHHQQQQHNSNYQQNHQVPYRHHSNSNTNNNVNYRHGTAAGGGGAGYHGGRGEDDDSSDGEQGEEDEEQDEYYGLGLPAFQREALVLVRGSCSSLKPFIFTETMLVTVILAGHYYCYQCLLQALKF